jgi:hypothetical protein
LVLFGSRNQTVDLQAFDDFFVWPVWCFSKQTKQGRFIAYNQAVKGFSLFGGQTTIKKINL